MSTEPEGKPTGMPGWQGWLAKLVLLAVPSLVILGIFAWRLDRYNSKLRFFDDAHQEDYLARDFSPLKTADMVQLGTAHSIANQPASSYRFFDPTKPEGVTRIGVFGCSFTRGAETIDGADFPSLLQAELNRRSDRRFEVINFGVGGYGLQQSYLLWQKLGASYDLDQVILNLFQFHQERDATFVQLYDAYGPVHARYILDETGLGLIEVAGSNRLEATQTYFRMFAPWRYLRYDSKPPVLLRALVPRDRSLGRNPLYYSRDPDELDKIYDLILADLAEQSRDLKILANDPEVYAWRERLPALADSFIMMQTPARSWTSQGLYRAVKGHLSALGNLVFAAELLSHLTGEISPQIALPTIRPAASPAASLDPTPELAPLDSYGEVYFGIANQPLAVFVSRLSEKPGQTEQFRFKASGVQSLLEWPGVTDPLFVGIDRLLENGSALSIEVRSTEGALSVPIGTLRAPSRVFGRLTRLPPHSPGRSNPAKVRLSVRGQHPVVMIRAAHPVTEAVLRIDDHPILIGEASSPADESTDRQVIALRPLTGVLLGLRGHPEQPPDVLSDAVEGPIDLVLVDGGGSSHSFPTLTLHAGIE